MQEYWEGVAISSPESRMVPKIMGELSAERLRNLHSELRLFSRSWTGMRVGRINATVTE